MQAGIKQQVLIDAMVPDFGLSSKMGIYARDAILILGICNIDVAMCSNCN